MSEPIVDFEKAEKIKKLLGVDGFIIYSVKFKDNSVTDTELNIHGLTTAIVCEAAILLHNRADRLLMKAGEELYYREGANSDS